MSKKINAMLGCGVGLGVLLGITGCSATTPSTHTALQTPVSSQNSSAISDYTQEALAPTFSNSFFEEGKSLYPNNTLAQAVGTIKLEDNVMVFRYYVLSDFYYGRITQQQLNTALQNISIAEQSFLNDFENMNFNNNLPTKMVNGIGCFYLNEKGIKYTISQKSVYEYEYAQDIYNKVENANSIPLMLQYVKHYGVMMEKASLYTKSEKPQNISSITVQNFSPNWLLNNGQVPMNALQAGLNVGKGK